MLNSWYLPKTAVFSGKSYDLNCDFRDILEILSYLEDGELCDYFKWQIALTLFYGEALPPEDQGAAMAYFGEFLRGGQPESGPPAPRLISWEQDTPLIIGEINKLIAREVREMPFVHWWTFLSWFHAIGEGPLALRVGIRQKLGAGQKLEPWEQTYYRANRREIDLPKKYSRAEQAERERLLRLLDGKKRQVDK